MTTKRFGLGAILLLTASTSFSYRYSTWIPPWNSNALTSIQANLGVLSESNPVWYSWNADGTIARNWNAENNTWRAAMTDTLLLPTVQNVVNKSFDGNAAAAVLATAQSRDGHASAIAQLVTLNAFDGIDIDYERIPTSSRANFTAFVSTLAAKLHAANKKLSVTVYAKTSDSANWNGPGAEDWAAIGRLADSVKIMGYDYSYSGSAPGPIAPLDWIDKVATYARSVIPNEKIMMGLPWYGYDWSSSGTTSVSYETAMLVARNSFATISHDANGEATFVYPGHTVFFQDATSYAAKVAMLKEKHSSIGGFAAWSAGVEDPAIWNVIRGAGIPATPAPADFSISGPTSLGVMRGSSATADYRLVPVNGFSTSANVIVQSPAGFNGNVTSDSPIVSAGGVVTIRVTTTSSTAAGTYQFTVRFTAGGLNHEQTVTLIVNVAPRRRAAK